ncbi:MAG: LamG-like jellyroll fold domain-containing protein [Patescibacteria group bacterium]
MTRERSGFTLIEIFIVVSVVSILSTIVVFVLNPAELLRQARDSSRISDLAGVSSALNIFNVDRAGSWIGTSSVVYVSIPDSSATCANLGLVALPSGWSYSCSSVADLRNVNGTGWIPVDFTAISTGAPISELPIDQTNTTSGDAFYTYVAGGNNVFVLGSVLESGKNLPRALNDGGGDPLSYEAGSSLSLAPFMHGLRGYWSFDDGNNSTTSDSSGYGNTGSWNGTSSPHYLAGKVGANAAKFNGMNDYVAMSGFSWASTTEPVTILYWNYISSTAPAFTTAAFSIGSNMPGGRNFRGATPGTGAGGTQYYFDYGVAAGAGRVIGTGYSSYDDAWTHVALVSKGIGGNGMSAYLNGNETLSSGNSESNLITATPLNIGRDSIFYHVGLIDEFLIYSRALTRNQIQAFYDATR